MLRGRMTVRAGPELHEHSFFALGIDCGDVQRVEKKSTYVYKDIDWEKFSETVKKRVVRVDENEPLPEEVEVLIKRRRSALKDSRRARVNCNVGWVQLMDTVVKETTAGIKRRIAEHENKKLEERL